MASNTQSPVRSNRMRSSLLSSPFDRYFRNDFLDLWNDKFPETVPSINITEKKDQFLVEMAAPGLKKEDFNVEMDGNMLTISCEKETENTEGDEGMDHYSRKEYSYSRFSRSLTLPDNADSSRISARYTDGILNLMIPKKSGQDKQGGKKINVE